ncbi:MAG TPA: DUF4012 domain-containing protein [Kineosporiaceae bacterium]|nr:DUF4012 domain-containing protein [Kineosporiaceae bacterium]
MPPFTERSLDALLDRLPRQARLRRLAAILAVLGVILLAFCGFSLWRGAQHAQEVVARMRAEAAILQRQAAAFDLRGASATLGRLRRDADDARATTTGPLWAAATLVPVVGDDVSAARDVSTSVAGVLDAAQPLEAALPRLDPSTMHGGRIDVDALAHVARTLPAVSAAVAQADLTVAGIDTAGLSAPLADGVRTLHSQLDDVRDPLANAVPGVQILPSMLGRNGTRTWLVLLEQDAEARGTGGLVGAYAVVTADGGKLTLTTAAQRSTLNGRRIPATAVPPDLRALWGGDITEWAGLNLSPHFPWTGQLVAAGWDSVKGTKLDYVAALDQYAVAALLAGTGPVQIGRDTVSAANAVAYLSRGVYRRYPRYQDVDRATEQLVTATFSRVAAGRIDLRALVKAVAEPAGQRRILAWSADPDEELAIQELSVGGALPDTPGPFAMAVVNNGGGNKLDAYLRVHTDYTPGGCVEGSRIGTMAVTLSSTAPRTGLTAYQSVRSDLLDDGIRHWVVGSNRILLDLYGPVGATAPLVTVDGVAQTPIVGSDRGHSVWRVIVPILPGQRRVVRAVVVQPVSSDGSDAAPHMLAQPMAIPATTSLGPAPECS